MFNEVLGIKLYTVKECAKLLGLSTKEVRRLLRQGDLYGTRINKTWFVPDPGLRAFEFIEAGRLKLRNEATELQEVLFHFLKSGDISQGHYDQATKRLADFLAT